MPVGGLMPGGNYQFQVRAVGCSTGYSDWSDPVSHMSMQRAVRAACCITRSLAFQAS